MEFVLRPVLFRAQHPIHYCKFAIVSNQSSFGIVCRSCFFILVLILRCYVGIPSPIVSRAPYTHMVSCVLSTLVRCSPCCIFSVVKLCWPFRAKYPVFLCSGSYYSHLSDTSRRCHCILYASTKAVQAMQPEYVMLLERCWRFIKHGIFYEF